MQELDIDRSVYVAAMYIYPTLSPLRSDSDSSNKLTSFWGQKDVCKMSDRHLKN